MSFDLVELQRRLANLIRLGSVEESSGALVRVKIGALLTDWLPCIQPAAGEDRGWSPVEAGVQVIVFSPSGDLAQGIVLAGLFQTAHPAPETSMDRRALHFKDGAILRYDLAAHKLEATLPAGATVEITAPGGVTINASGGATVNGKTTINGDLDVQGKVTASGDVKAGAISLQQHKHLGVQPGSGTSGLPTP